MKVHRKQLRRVFDIRVEEKNYSVDNMNRKIVCCLLSLERKSLWKHSEPVPDTIVQTNKCWTLCSIAYVQLERIKYPYQSKSNTEKWVDRWDRRIIYFLWKSCINIPSLFIQYDPKTNVNVNPKQFNSRSVSFALHRFMHNNNISDEMAHN